MRYCPQEIGRPSYQRHANQLNSVCIFFWNLPNSRVQLRRAVTSARLHAVLGLKAGCFEQTKVRKLLVRELKLLIGLPFVHMWPAQRRNFILFGA